MVYYRRIIVHILLVAGILSATTVQAQERPITVVFRFDDYSSLSPTDLERQVIDLLAWHRFSCTFAVIPFITAGDYHDPRPQELVPLSSEKIQMLKAAVDIGVVEPALHGFSHQTLADEAPDYTEFAGVRYETQNRKIAEGKQFLDSNLQRSVTIFVPPWETYDANTVKALEATGFSCLSAEGMRYEPVSSQLAFLPKTCNLWTLQEAVTTARQLSRGPVVVLALFHHFDFVEFDQTRGRLTMQQFGDLLDWVSAQGDIEVRSVNSVIAAPAAFGVQAYKDNNTCPKLTSLLPPWVATWAPNTMGIFMPAETARSVRTFMIIIVGGTYVVVLAVSGFVGYAVGSHRFRRIRPIATLCKYGGGPIILLMGAYVFHDSAVGYKGLVILVSMFGAWVGVIIALRISKNSVLCSR